MKIKAKTKAILYYNNAETIVEVIVAFLVLSIIMVLFARGITFASTAEKHAIDNINTADDAMIRLQKVVTDQNPKPAGVTGETEDPGELDDQDILILKKYTVTYASGGDTNSYIYYVFDAKLG